MNDEIKKADEFARALRDYASDCDSDSEYCFQCTFACVCDKFDNNAPKIIADLIDSLTAQLTESQRRENAAVELIDEIRSDATGDWSFIMFKIDNWRGPQEAEKGEAD